MKPVLGLLVKMIKTPFSQEGRECEGRLHAYTQHMTPCINIQVLIQVVKEKKCVHCHKLDDISVFLYSVRINKQKEKLFIYNFFTVKL